MNKKIKILTIMIGLMTLVTVSQAQNKKTALALKATITRFFDGISGLKDKAIKKEVAKDFLLIENGKVMTIDSFLVQLAPLRNYAIKRINKLDFFLVEEKGNMAWVAYHNYAQITVNNKEKKLHWLESAVLILENQEWKIRLLHSTKID